MLLTKSLMLMIMVFFMNSFYKSSILELEDWEMILDEAMFLIFDFSQIMQIWSSKLLQMELMKNVIYINVVKQETTNGNNEKSKITDILQFGQASYY